MWPAVVNRGLQGDDIPDDPWCDDLNPKICNFENINLPKYKDEFN